jgi:gliding motility-associated-like protein
LQNCSTEPSFEVSVAVTENPAAPVFTANATSLCAGETLTLSTTVVAGGYTWSGPNGYVASTATPPAVEAVNILASGSYQLVVNNGACLSAPYSVDVVVHALPAAPAVSSNSPICAGDALEITSVTAANAYSLVFPNSTTDVSTTGAWVINNANASTSGVYTVSVFDGFCWSAPSAPLTIQVDVVPAEQAYAGAHVTACLDGFAVVEAVNDPSLQGSWSAPNNDLTFGSPNSSVSTVSGMVAGETSLATWSLWNAGCGVYSSDEVVVYAPLLPEAYEDYFELIEGEGAPLNVVANDEPGPVAYNLQIITPPTFGEAQVVEGQNIRYIPDATFSGTDELVYRICLTACPDMCDTAIVKLRVFPFLRIPDIITPNGDGVNDVWVIEGIDRFESTELFIYNRWGREVYAANNYANDWDALWNGQPLPNGTYFYVLNNRSTGENLGRGYITVHQ